MISPYYYYYYLLLWEFSTPTLADGFSLEFDSKTARLLASLELFSVFWPILIMLSFRWSPLVHLFPILPVPIPILKWLYRTHRLQLISLSLSCSIVFSVPLQGSGTYLSFCLSSVSLCGLLGRQKPQFIKSLWVFSFLFLFLFFCCCCCCCFLLSLDMIVRLRLDDPFVSQIPPKNFVRLIF